MAKQSRRKIDGASGANTLAKIFFRSNASPGILIRREATPDRSRAAGGRRSSATSAAGLVVGLIGCGRIEGGQRATTARSEGLQPTHSRSRHAQPESGAPRRRHSPIQGTAEPQTTKRASP